MDYRFCPFVPTDDLGLFLKNFATKSRNFPFKGRLLPAILPAHKPLLVMNLLRLELKPCVSQGSLP